MLSIVDVTVTQTDGRPVDSAMLTVSSLAEPLMMSGGGRGIRNHPLLDHTLTNQPGAVRPEVDPCRRSQGRVWRPLGCHGSFLRASNTMTPSLTPNSEGR
jgi:hypothetical protein